MDEADMLLDPPPGGWGEVVTRDWLQLVLDARFAPIHEKLASHRRPGSRVDRVTAHVDRVGDPRADVEAGRGDDRSVRRVGGGHQALTLPCADTP